MEKTFQNVYKHMRVCICICENMCLHMCNYVHVRKYAFEVLLDDGVWLLSLENYTMC